MCGPNAASLSVCIGCAGHLYASAALHCVSSCAGGTEARERDCAATAEMLEKKTHFFLFLLMEKMFFFFIEKKINLLFSYHFSSATLFFFIFLLI